MWVRSPWMIQSSVKLSAFSVEGQLEFFLGALLLSVPVNFEACDEEEMQ